jgi:DNA (cytosine-5)-methyltransferase 1
MDDEKQLTFGSLFAGIGGFDLGFERAGMECKWQVELDDHSTKVLEKHWPQVHRERDIRTVGKHNLETVDVICGGFPCQDISYAGLGAGLDGERSGLFFEAIRVVRELQPRVVVLENVAALLTRGLDRVLGTLAEIGFDAEWHCIPAAYVGAPHIRDRVFVLAYAKSIGDTQRGQSSSRAHDTRAGGSKRFNVDGSVCRERTMANTDSERLEKRQRENAIRAWAISRTEPIGSVWWAIEPAMGRVADGVPNRVDRLKGLGNAVVPQVAEFIGRQIMEACK